MSEILIECKKYGQITLVTVDGKECYKSATVPKYEADHIKTLLNMMNIENVRVEVK